MSDLHSIEDVIAGRESWEARLPTVAGLFSKDGLGDSVVLGLRVDLFENRAYLLIQTWGLAEDLGDTAIVMIDGLRSLQWGSKNGEGRSWRMLDIWEGTKAEDGHGLRAVDSTGDELALSGRHLVALTGFSPVSSQPPPDLETASDAEVTAGVLQWTSPFTPAFRSADW